MTGHSLLLEEVSESHSIAPFSSIYRYLLFSPQPTLWLKAIAIVVSVRLSARPLTITLLTPSRLQFFTNRNYIWHAECNGSSLFIPRENEGI